MYSVHSITIALWLMAICNAICAGFWAVQTYNAHKWRNQDGKRNDDLAKIQIEAQGLQNQAIKQQIELFKINTEAANIALAQQKAEAGAPNQLLNLRERDKQNATRIDALDAGDEQSAPETTGGILRDWPKKAE